MSFEGPEKERLFKVLTEFRQELVSYDFNTNQKVIDAIKADIQAKIGWRICQIIDEASSKYHVLWEKRA